MKALKRWIWRVALRGFLEHIDKELTRVLNEAKADERDELHRVHHPGYGNRNTLRRYEGRVEGIELAIEAINEACARYFDRKR